MFYVTYPISKNAPIEQLTFQDLLQNHTPAHAAPETAYHITRAYDNLNRLPTTTRRLHSAKAVQFENNFRNILEQFSSRTMSEYYTTFNIPKQSGGLRTIKAPHDDLKEIMRQILAFLQSFLYPAQAAYAYTRHRTIKNAIESHKEKEYEWFLKIDLHDFFGSSEAAFVKKTLKQIPFFNFLLDSTLNHFIHFITLDNGLPQGTPLSPFITNLLMIPFDYKVSREIAKHKGHYTRYADDMLISTTSKNATGHMIRIIREHLTELTPYTINNEKTKVSSIYGKNWNLGLMLNKDREITVGHRNKERFRATIFEFCNNPAAWNSQNAMELLGKFQYYKGIEEDYFENLLTKYGNKFNMDVRAAIIQRIKEG